MPSNLNGQYQAGLKNQPKLMEKYSSFLCFYVLITSFLLIFPYSKCKYKIYQKIKITMTNMIYENGSNKYGKRTMNKVHQIN